MRIAVPYTGIIISTRESKSNGQAMSSSRLGVSQITGGSAGPASAATVEPEPEDDNSEQFDVSDTTNSGSGGGLAHRPRAVCHRFCTACYREGRTGDRFMSLVQEQDRYSQHAVIRTHS